MATKPAGAKGKRGGSRGKAREKYARLPVTEHVRLGQRIVLLRHMTKPTPWPAVSRKVGVPVRTAQRMYQDAVEVSALYQDPTGQRMIDRSLAVLEELLDRIAELANTTESDSVQLGALKTLASLEITRLELMAGLGRLPTRPEVAFGWVALGEMIQRFKDVLQGFELPTEVHEAVEEMYRETRPVIEGRLALPSGSQG